MILKQHLIFVSLIFLHIFKMSQKKLFDTHLCNSEHLKTFPGVTQSVLTFIGQTDRQTPRQAKYNIYIARIFA